MTASEESLPLPMSASQQPRPRIDLTDDQALRENQYVLYDYDAGELVTTRVFSRHGDAADAAGHLQNVLIIPIAIPPADSVQSAADEAADQTCDCELPGFFHCGIPGIIAQIENGRLAPGATVERCDLCEQYASDEAARQKLVELGLT
jgi:hypothetical protein